MPDVNYISQEGLDKLREELEKRKSETRKEISERIGTAKEQGDLSENFEYQEAKDQQAENERQIAALEQMINRSVVIEQKTGGDSISVGSSFVAELPDGTKKEFEIVGASETDPINGKISNESPLGQAFLEKSVGETAEFDAPAGTVSYKITEIK